MADLEYPTADAVARVIVLACRVTKDDPVAVVEGAFGARARHYAGQALATVYPGCPADAVGRFVGAKTPRAFLASSKTNTKGGAFPWFKRDVLKTLIEDACAAKLAASPARATPALSVGEAPAAPQRPAKRLSADVGGYVSADAPAPSASKNALREMLRQAVQNTAAMTLREE